MSSMHKEKELKVAKLPPQNDSVLRFFKLNCDKPPVGVAAEAPRD